MNGSQTAVVTPGWRLTAFRRSEGFPLIPVAILTLLALLAIFADVVSPHNP
jgi:hypothetical protein